ncbi:MAG: hypothetical protein ACMXYF_01045 [Candidatus Woesearchaeota archaeon]
MLEAYEKLQKSEEFEKTDLTGFELVHCFCMKSPQIQHPPWQFGYYHLDKQQMIEFHVHDSKIEIMHNSELLKDPNTQLLALSLDGVLSQQEIEEKTIAFLEKTYTHAHTQTKILLLQNIAEFGIVWNVTYILITWQTVNVKFDAKTGEVKAHAIQNLLDTKQGN